MKYYFTASLPEVSVGSEPPISVADFDNEALNWLSPGECRKLAGITLPDRPGDVPGSLPRVYREFFRFEIALRSKIAKRRADRLGAAVEIPESDELYSEIDRAIAAASAADDPAEREDIIDTARWAFLDELDAAHFFDFEHLCIYRLKLQIAEKRRFRHAEVGRENFNTALEAVLAAGNTTVGTEA